MLVFEKHLNSKLVGLSGTFYAGKDTAADYLEKHFGFMHVSTGDVLREEADSQGKDHKRDTLIEIGVELRKLYGSLGALVIRGIEKWERQRESYPGGLVVSGLRLVGESMEIKNQHGKLLFIDAPVGVRYERAKESTSAGKNKHDLPGSLEQFIESERAELEGIGGVERPNLRGVQAIADETILNDSGLDDYYGRVRNALGL
ncbi:MAG: AAA family ATPase [Candidatus Saccharimonadales bacterium]